MSDRSFNKDSLNLLNQKNYRHTRMFFYLINLIQLVSCAEMSNPYENPPSYEEASRGGLPQSYYSLIHKIQPHSGRLQEVLDKTDSCSFSIYNEEVIFEFVDEAKIVIKQVLGTICADLMPSLSLNSLVKISFVLSLIDKTLRKDIIKDKVTRHAVNSYMDSDLGCRTCFDTSYYVELEDGQISVRENLGFFNSSICPNDWFKRKILKFGLEQL